LDAAELYKFLPISLELLFITRNSPITIVELNVGEARGGEGRDKKKWKGAHEWSCTEHREGDYTSRGDGAVKFISLSSVSSTIKSR
jgi:hypothetical protein